MSFQIRSIAVYSPSGERREVNFELGQLNIVTGGPATGKSSLLDIVDYCWGRDECTVAEGEIRWGVDWFAVLFDREGEGVLVARRNPGPAGYSSDEIFLARNVDELPLTSVAFRKTTTAAGLRLTLTRLLGIGENVSQAEASRIGHSASAGQAIFFCLQAQDEIANRRLLFHRQGEPHIPTAIKDTLPYFLGAMEEDYFLKQKRYDDARSRLRKLERQLHEIKALADQATATVEALIRDAKAVGLLPPNAMQEDAQDARRLLELAARPQQFQYASVDRAGADLSDLEGRRRELRQRLVEVKEEIDHFVRMNREAGDFETEARENHARLSSIGLLPEGGLASDVCPICESHLPVATPSVDDMQRLLEGLNDQLSSVRRDSPRLQRHIGELEARRGALEGELREVQRDISSRIADNERLRIEQDVFSEQARVSGRIAYYLENVKAFSEDTGIKTEYSRLRAQVVELAKALDPEALGERVATALNLVSRDLTAYAQELRLEHGESALRLDRKNLTVVADTLSGPLPLTQMGSGQNWVGYHVAAHLALHRLFRRRGRPVPAFLMLDQPSQAHYPPEKDVGLLDKQDEDQEAVTRLFRLLRDYPSTFDGDMQVIVVDHVELLDDWFRHATVDRWRDGIKLVPASWLRDRS
jgi:hypothetical protein